MSNDPKSKIEAMRDDELSPEDRQRTRFVNGRILDEFIDPAEIKRRHDQHDDLWWAFGWITQILVNWKKLLVVAIIGVFLGGETLIANVSALLKGLMP